MAQLSIFERVYVDGELVPELTSVDLVPSDWFGDMTPAQILDVAHVILAGPDPFGGDPFPFHMLPEPAEETR